MLRLDVVAEYGVAIMLSALALSHEDDAQAIAQSLRSRRASVERAIVALLRNTYETSSMAESRAWRDIWEQVPTWHKQDGNIRGEAPVQTVLRLLRELEDEEEEREAEEEYEMGGEPEPTTERNCALPELGGAA